MPVAKRTNARQAIVVAAAGVVIAVGFVFLAIVLGNRGGTGEGESFDLLEVATLLRLQEQDGVPTCFDDPATGNRPICVFHTGGPDDQGWVAYDAQVEGCPFEPLSPEATELVDSCTGDTYPFDGEGLTQYDVRVDEDRLEIDLVGDDERD